MSREMALNALANEYYEILKEMENAILAYYDPEDDDTGFKAVSVLQRYLKNSADVQVLMGSLMNTPQQSGDSCDCWTADEKETKIVKL